MVNVIGDWWKSVVRGDKCRTKHFARALGTLHPALSIMISRMRYLRMFTNAIVGGLLGAAYLAVLVLQLNPQVPIASATAARWFAALLAFYGLYLTSRSMC